MSRDIDSLSVRQGWDADRLRLANSASLVTRIQAYLARHVYAKYFVPLGYLVESPTIEGFALLYHVVMYPQYVKDLRVLVFMRKSPPSSP